MDLTLLRAESDLGQPEAETVLEEMAVEPATLETRD